MLGFGDRLLVSGFWGGFGGFAVLIGFGPGLDLGWWVGCLMDWCGRDVILVGLPQYRFGVPSVFGCWTSGRRGLFWGCLGWGVALGLLSGFVGLIWCSYLWVGRFGLVLLCAF